MSQPTPLQPFTVSVRCIDPSQPQAVLAGYELPVDSPDAEHAVSAAMSNAVAFTTKVESDGSMVSVAFQAVGVRSGH